MRYVFLLFVVLAGWCVGANMYVDNVLGDVYAEYTSATYDNTAKTITKAGAFASSTGWTFEGGEHIQIVSGTGITAGYYVVTGRTNDDTITVSGLVGTGDNTDTRFRVGNDGSSATVSSSSLAGPMRTIALGKGGVGTGETVYIKAGTAYTEAAILLNSNKNITFEGYTATPGDNGQATLTLTGASTGGLIRVAGSFVANSIYTFKNLIINGNATAAYGIYNDTGTTTGASFIFNNVDFAGTSTTKTFLHSEASTTAIRTVSFTNCGIVGAANGYCANVTDAASVVLSNTSFTGASVGLSIAGVVGSLSVGSGSVISSSGLSFDADGLTANTTGAWLISGNTITSTTEHTLRIPKYVQLLTVSNNIITAGEGRMGIYLGADAATNANPLGRVIVFGNAVKWATGDDCGHGILIGSGCNGAVVYGNRVDATALDGSTVNLGCVVKSEYCTVIDNMFKARRALYLKGGGYNYISQNTLVSTGLYALTWATDTDEPYRNTIINNIIDGSGGTYALLVESGGNASNYMDYNYYIAGSTNLGYDGSSPIANITEMRTFTGADVSSDVVTTASLDANYQARNSQLKNAGTPLLIKSDGTVLLRNDIGATKFTSSGSNSIMGGGGLMGN